MSSWIVYLISSGALTALELLYFRIADHYNIIDKPNQRSSHTIPTIRGAGVVFPAAVLIWFGFHMSWYWFVAGMVIISIISFADDLKPVSSGLRASIHVLAVALLFYQLSLFQWSVPLVLAAFIVSVGAISAFNFMDGINGITGMYALVNLFTFWAINQWVVAFSDADLLIIGGMAVVLFLYFNLRTRARCFAGDVGSVSLAFLQIFLMFQLIKATDDLLWVGVCLVFGTDSVLTIIYRLKQKENIFKPHRQHVYQYLSNELKWSHQKVSLLYACLQLVINLLLIAAYIHHLFLAAVVLMAAYFVLFALVRIAVTKRVKAVMLM